LAAPRADCAGAGPGLGTHRTSRRTPASRIRLNTGQRRSVSSTIDASVSPDSSVSTWPRPARLEVRSHVGMPHTPANVRFDSDRGPAELPQQRVLGSTALDSPAISDFFDDYLLWPASVRIQSDSESEGPADSSDGKGLRKVSLFRKRLKGFEPSTFCMASRTRDLVQRAISLENTPLLPRKRVPPMAGIHREITGVSGLKPDWR
jgi:hypothetical protein